MAFVRDAVPGEALDYDEIFLRGGQNFGDEDFALCKCPHCGRLYLIEYEVDTIYLDPDDLSQREDIYNVVCFRCEACSGTFPKGAWIGAKAPADMQVTWDNLAASPWRWITATNTSPRDMMNQRGKEFIDGNEHE
jgi:hypothetical protein